MAAGSPRMLRELNDRAVLDLLADTAELSRAELESATGLSKAATSSLIARLEAAGLVEQVGVRGGGVGPRTQLWGLRANRGFIAGIDVTVDGVDVAVADLRGTVVGQRKATVPPSKLSKPLSTLVAALDRACNDAGIRRTDLNHIVVGVAGALDPKSGRLRYASHLRGWNELDLRDALESQFDVPVDIENDVNLIALNEKATGNALDAQDFLLLWLSNRGVGSAVVVGGELMRGAHLGAGEIGFVPVPDLARADTSPTGHRFGDRLAHAAIVDLARAHGIVGRTPLECLDKAVACGRDGEPFIEDLARRIAAGLAAVVSLLDPELILLAGELGTCGGEQLSRAVTDQLQRLVQSDVRLRIASEQSNSVRAGAVRAALIPAREHLFATASNGS